MKTVWIRHADKLYNNEKGPFGCKQHDPGIIGNEETLQNVDFLVRFLVEKYGIPKHIFCSPFLRARQTADLLIKNIEKIFDVKIEYTIDTTISEYLGFCSKNGLLKKADIEEETLYHFKRNDLYVNESINALESRVVSHIKNLESYQDTKWVITHGLVMSKIYEYCYNSKLERPTPLDFFTN